MDAPRPVEVKELALLLVRMEQAVADTGRAFAFKMTAIAGFFALMAVVYALVTRVWGIAAILVGFAAGMAWLGRAAARRTSPERMQPVLDAVRDAPGTVERIRHYTTSDSRRLFVSHWLEVRTGQHRLVMKAQDEWMVLLDILRRRCPGASVTGM